MKVVFSQPYITGRESSYVEQVLLGGHLSGDGPFTRRAHLELQRITQARRVLLTHSCTAALEMSAMLANVGPGDEVIMPSFTFVSTANAFVLRGATVVFVDIREDTLNLDEKLIEAALSEKTRAIVPVHYAGVACEMTAILEIARRHDLLVIEDAAQALGATYNGQHLGTFGQLGTLSFHETKNIISGEGGALLINDDRFCERAEILREKGTNRSRFFRGQVDKYSWVDIGSSYLPSELVSAVLVAQLEQEALITKTRREYWATYHEGLKGLEVQGFLRRPIIPKGALHNGHIYYILLPDIGVRSKLMDFLSGKGISSLFHYVPLHSSEGGRRMGRLSGDLSKTEAVGDRILRLPLYMNMGSAVVEHVVAAVVEFFESL